jgi:sec-independent protein translocase protein TatA
MFGDIGFPEIILILVVVLIIFGAGKLPEIGKSLGKGISEFRKARYEDDENKSKATVATDKTEIKDKSQLPKST